MQSSDPLVRASPAPLDLVKKRIALTSYNIQEDELRARALNKFKVLVSLDPQATQIGRSMLDALGRLEDNDTVMHILSDSLATKATGARQESICALEVGQLAGRIPYGNLFPTDRDQRL